MNTKRLINSAIASAIALAAASAPMVLAHEGDTPDMEKCYGIAIAGYNGCETGPGTECAGSSVLDRQGDMWMLVHEGTCDKIVGGSTTPIPMEE